MSKIGSWLFLLQFIVLAAALVALLFFGDWLREYGLRKTTMIVLYMAGLPSVLSVVVLLTTSKDEKTVDKIDDSSTPKSPQ
jgi:hypothetical protein